MGIFTVIPQDAMDTLQVDAGVLLTYFNPYNPYATPDISTIFAVTSGGINPTCKATRKNYADNIDNAKGQMKEFERITGWECGMSFTSIRFNEKNTIWALGSADVTTLTNGVKKIVPRSDIDQANDFHDLWWVGDKANGGAYAIRLKNAYSTGGLNIKSSKDGTGTNQITLGGFFTLANQNDVPMEFYDIPAEAAGTVFAIALNLFNVTSTNTNISVAKNGTYSTTLTAASGYEIESVTVSMGGVDITGLCYNSSTGAITVPGVTAPVIISAVAVASA